MCVAAINVQIFEIHVHTYSGIQKTILRCIEKYENNLSTDLKYEFPVIVDGTKLVIIKKGIHSFFERHIGKSIYEIR